MKKRLNEDVMVPGDIALTTTNAFVSRKIRTATKSSISHAMLYVTHCSIIHAVGEGVHAENTQRIFFDEKTPVLVMRLKGGLDSDACQQICNYVRQIVGSEYSVREAIQAATGKGRRVTAKQFCSRLIAQAYHRQGYSLAQNPDYCSPGEILRSNLLVEVPNATKPVSDEEVAFWEASENNSPDLMLSAINYILDEVRKTDSSVQKLSDVGGFIIHKPEHDQWVNDLYVSSGYLDIWKVDYDSHPWRWNIQEMEKLGDPVGVRMYCLNTLKTEPRDDNRFTKTLAGYQLDHGRFPRKTFATLIQLYKKLVELHALRIDTAREWLRRNGGC